MYSLAFCVGTRYNHGMGIDLFAEKYYDDEIEEASEFPWEHIRRNGYGFIRIKNPHYMVDGDEHEFFVRKPTPAERREIIINTVIECNGRTFRIPVLSHLLGVSDRTVQAVLRRLEREGLIEIIPKKTKSGAQRCNVYRYIGPPCEKYGSGLTLKLLYDTKHDVGIRDWNWKVYSFAHNKVWHNNYPLCEAKFEQRKARHDYLVKNNLPVTTPENVKYIVLRYSYWRGEKEKLKHFLFSKDGSIKFPLFPLGRSEKISLYGNPLLIEFGGLEENPVVTVSDGETGEMFGIFNWFYENIIQVSRELDDDHAEQYFIVGDFTTK